MGPARCSPPESGHGSDPKPAAVAGRSGPRLRAYGGREPRPAAFTCSSCSGPSAAWRGGRRHLAQEARTVRRRRRPGDETEDGPGLRSENAAPARPCGTSLWAFKQSWRIPYGHSETLPPSTCMSLISWSVTEILLYGPVPCGPVPCFGT